VRSAANVAWAAGPLVVASYLVAAAISTRWRSPIVEAAVASGAVTVGWHVSKRFAPGNEASRIGFESVQVLLAWESVALWCGAAVVLGFCAPIFRDFRGTGGIGAAVAIAAVHTPATLLSGLGAFAVGMAIFRGRTKEALAVGLAAPPAYEWVAWAADIQGGWGVNHGPELALWTAAVTSILLARWWSPIPHET
jgi:glycerol-3-phosphate acyltransferase PlsY